MVSNAEPNPNVLEGRAGGTKECWEQAREEVDTAIFVATMVSGKDAPPNPDDLVMPAVLAFGLAVHEGACWRCWGRDGPEGAGARDWSRACPVRAQLEALAGKEG